VEDVEARGVEGCQVGGDEEEAGVVGELGCYALVFGFVVICFC
jgi:hypothetical protein